MSIRLHYGIAVAVFYMAFASATAGFVALAMTQDVALVSRDYYEEGLGHDRQMLARANAEALGDDLQIVVDHARGRVTVRWPAAMAPHVRGSATWYRPSDPSSDREQPIVVDASGRVDLPTGALRRGLWHLQLRWRTGDTPYYAERLLVLP